MNARFFAAVLLLCLQNLAHADVWTIRADPWCPYNCEPRSAQPGFMIEIIEQAAKAAGHTVDYAIMPWSRALPEARAGKISGVVGIAAQDREGLLITGRLGVDTACFFVKRGFPLKYTSLTDLVQVSSLGVIQDYTYFDGFMQWQKTNAAKMQYVSGDHALVLNAKKLVTNRIQAFVDNINVVDHARATIPELKDVVSAGCMEPTDLFAGFGASNPKSEAMVRAINTKVAELKKSGDLKKLLEKYGVPIW